MTYLNPICADAGTENCPCLLAETGDCLVCSRLSGRKECDCRWAGVCIYNEYIQNGSKVRAKRENRSADILKKHWYGEDLLMFQLRVSRGIALEASRPGSFLFLKAPGAPDVANVPVSILSTDEEHGSVRILLKVISAKTKMLAVCDERLEVRGVYHSGFLGKGLAGLQDDIKPFSYGDAKTTGDDAERTGPRWLILTRGAGFAPAVNLIRWAAGNVSIRMISDPENIGKKVIREQMNGADSGNSGKPEADSERGSLHLEFRSLAKLLDCLEAASPVSDCPIRTSLDPDRLTQTSPDPVPGAPVDTSPRPPLLHETDYDRIFLMASDYYIKRLAAAMKIPPEKLVFCNNFRMCCGEGICGACGYTDAAGKVKRMCKCRDLSAQDMLLPV